MYMSILTLLFFTDNNEGRTHMADMTGKTVIITRGGKGLGFGIANAFAKEGANLVITGRTAATLEKAKAELEALGAQVIYFTADGAEEDAVNSVVAQTIEKYGRIDVLINNAQASKSGLMLEEHTKKDFDLAINSGLYATFFYMKACFPHLKETKGVIINFASGAGLNGRLGQSSYAAAKEGIRGMTRVAANEWGQYGINVNVVCPLAMTESLAQWKEDYPEIYEKTLQGVPMRRFADPEGDVGRVCVFLASEDASFITGETISVQGGGSLRP